MKKILWLTFLTLMIGCSAAFADTLTLVSPPPGPSYGGYYIAPYYLQLNQPTGPILQLTCVDPAHSITQGQTWGITIQDVSTDTKFQGLAYLISQYSGHPAAIQWAIWEIMMPGFAAAHMTSDPAHLLTLPDTDINGIAYWVKQYNDGNKLVGTKLTYYEPTGGAGQGFLGLPEPGSILLIGIGFLVVSLGYSFRTRE
jgi:hypothetical protein